MLMASVLRIAPKWLTLVQLNAFKTTLALQPFAQSDLHQNRNLRRWRGRQSAIFIKLADTQTAT